LITKHETALIRGTKDLWGITPEVLHAIVTIPPHMETLLAHVGITFLVIGAYVTLWFLVSILIKRNDIADVAWGVGIALVGAVGLMLAPDNTHRLTIMSLLVTVWGLRLSHHIYKRILSHRDEDYRYAVWRKEWKHFYTRSFAQVYLLQGFLMVVVGYSLIHVSAMQTTPLTWLDSIALLVWIVGFFIEARADKQLRTFIANKPAGDTVLDTGLWRYSRHPNYFGEVVQWWGIWLFALSTPYGWFAILSPLAITFLILKVSGIPMLEAKLMQNPAYREYAGRTSMFVPRPQKK
jgi:steroid 5-alpha reductase family enzyme